MTDMLRAVGDEADDDHERRRALRPVPASPDHTWEVEAGVVRPYLFTRGRTRSANRHLAVETMVAATPLGRDKAACLPPEQRGVVELCARPQSVAELGARLSAPLGVMRVLVADLADDELVQVHEATADLAGDVQLLERLIARVRAIPA
jgi:hypothetical protein